MVLVACGNKLGQQAIVKRLVIKADSSMGWLTVGVKKNQVLELIEDNLKRINVMDWV